MAAYPTIRSAESDKPEVRGRILTSDLAIISTFEAAELEIGHLPAIVIMEIERPDGTVWYEAVSGPNCSHLCAQCRVEIDRGMAEFGDGAIGAFADSSGGEMERLRRELRQLALTMTSAVHAINARLPEEKHQALGHGAARSTHKTLPPAGVVRIPMRDMAHSQGVEIVEAIITDPEDDDVAHE